MTRLFGNLFGSHFKEKALRAAARNPVGKCPSCQKPLDDHFYWDVASVEAGTPEADTASEFVRNARWADAARYQAANAQVDIRVWRAIRCPTRGLALVPLLLTFEMWKDDVAEPAVPLSSAAAEGLLAYVADRWRPF
jgi:hypothetical protein